MYTVTPMLPTPAALYVNIPLYDKVCKYVVSLTRRKPSPMELKAFMDGSGFSTDAKISLADFLHNLFGEGWTVEGVTDCSL